MFLTKLLQLSDRPGAAVAVELALCSSCAGTTETQLAQASSQQSKMTKYKYIYSLLEEIVISAW